MIRQYFAIGFVLCSFVLARAGGKDFWETKPYPEWTDKEVDRLLKNSPWSKAVTVSGGMLSRRGGPMGEGIDRQSGQPNPRTGGTEGVNPGGIEGGANPGGGMRRPEGELGGFSDRSGATV